MNLDGRSIEVVVGSSPSVTFSVHEILICSSSNFFKKAFQGGWKESQDRLVRLERDDPDVFSVYLHWLYYHTLPVRVDEPGVVGNAEYMQLAKAYILGDMLQDGSFQDAVMDAMMDKTASEAADGKRWYPVGPVIRLIYENTLESSKARLFLVDMYTFHGQGPWLTEWAVQEDLPKDFLLDVAVSLLEHRPCPQSYYVVQGSCRYHQHGPEVNACYKNVPALRPKLG
ncbi:hypothetical protein ACKAV7_009815 [Fusarium commune]|uniref:Kelch-like protein 10 n=1 Tax=Fusarium oxysporum f. sp. rapae TaxID=485398 RepID=A0A8J5NRR3_FUSOX|nr:Kelch-like protein 10 [Fusarium oxysporum f. sp. rapae]KAI7759088.1 hypothetical protein LZL87_012827 [Fusarium oxysporum]